MLPHPVSPVGTYLVTNHTCGHTDIHIVHASSEAKKNVLSCSIFFIFSFVLHHTCHDVSDETDDITTG